MGLNYYWHRVSNSLDPEQDILLGLVCIQIIDKVWGMQPSSYMYVIFTFLFGYNIALSVWHICTLSKVR